MTTALINILASPFEQGEWTGSWDRESVSQLEETIRARLKRDKVDAVVLQAADSPGRSVARSVVFIEFVFPEHEDDSIKLVSDAALARLHAAIARSDDERSLQQVTRSPGPVFPIKARSFRDGGAPFDYSAELLESACCRGGEADIQFPNYETPRNGLRDYAKRIVARVRTCPLRDLDATHLYLPPGVDEAVKKRRGERFAGLLPFLFKVTHSRPLSALVAAALGTTGAPFTEYLAPETADELKQLLQQTRAHAVLFSAEFNPQPVFDSLPSWTARAGRLGSAEEHGPYVAYLSRNKETSAAHNAVGIKTRGIR